MDKYLDMFPDMPLSQKYYPIPIDIFSGQPSNSIIDWTKLLQVPIRMNKPLDRIMEDIRSSPKYIDIYNSEWSHLLTDSAPPNREHNQVGTNDAQN